MARHNLHLLIVGVGLIISLQPYYSTAQPQNNILKVAGSLQKSEGRVTAYYPPSVEKQAKSVQDLLEKAVVYYDRHLGISFPISVVLFGPDEYARLTKESDGEAAQYNEFLPFVTPGPPKVMCLPATSGSALDSLTQLALKRSPSLKKLNLPIAEISQRFTALVGLHELGHQYIRELEICQSVHWLQEMLANFIADAFLTDVSPNDSLIWQTVNHAYDDYLKPTNRTFSGIHKGNQENYVWWQGHITLRVHDVFEQNGFDFLQKLKKLSNVKIYHEDDLSFIIALDEIAPGFENWAEKSGHITKVDKVRLDSIETKVRRETSEAIAQNMPNAYTALYSNDWTAGNTLYRKVVMDFLKDFETNSFKRDDLLNEYVELYLPGANNYFEKAKAMAKLKEIMSVFNNLKIRLEAVMPLKSIDSDDDWVYVYGSMTSTNQNGDLQANDFFQQFKMSKEGKISLIKQYELATR